VVLLGDTTFVTVAIAPWYRLLPERLSYDWAVCSVARIERAGCYVHEPDKPERRLSCTVKRHRRRTAISSEDKLHEVLCPPDVQ
jgi:hypothetical protein